MKPTIAITMFDGKPKISSNAWSGLFLYDNQGRARHPLLDLAEGGTGTNIALKGDLLVGTGFAWSNRSVGGDGQILMADSAVATYGLKWTDHLVASLCQGRLTLEMGVPISTTDQTAKTTIYFTPYKGNTVSLYNGSRWAPYAFTERSVAVPSTTVTPFDVFIYDSSGTLTLETVNWTNDTTRATALVLQDGVWVKSGATGRRYLGTGRTTSVSGETADSLLKRFIWNYYNRVEHKLKVIDTTDTWTYGTAAWRQARGGASGNFVELVIGLSEELVTASAQASIASGNQEQGSVGVGVDSATTNSADLYNSTGAASGALAANSVRVGAQALYSGYLSIGYHQLIWLEYARVGTVTFEGDGGFANQQSGLVAKVMG